MSERTVEATLVVPEGMSVSVRTTVPKYLTGKDHVRLFSVSASALAKDKELNLTDLRVFLGLIPHVQFENVIEVSQAVLAEELEIAQPNVSKSLLKLSEKGYIEVIGQKKRQKVYKLNSHVAAKARGGAIQKMQGEQLPIKQPIPIGK